MPFIESTLALLGVSGFLETAVELGLLVGFFKALYDLYKEYVSGK